MRQKREKWDDFCKRMRKRAVFEQDLQLIGEEIARDEEKEKEKATKLVGDSKETRLQAGLGEAIEGKE